MLGYGEQDVNLDKWCAFAVSKHSYTNFYGKPSIYFIPILFPRKYTIAQFHPKYI